jgi:hypothetical protein
VIVDVAAVVVGFVERRDVPARADAARARLDRER